MKFVVGVRDSFSAAHAIPGHKKCGRIHGHNFDVSVEVEGELKNGMVIDFFELKSILKEILEKFDHSILNETIENPTSENIALHIFQELKKRGLNVVRVRVSENTDKWAEIRI
ncbi:MAG: 6-carboxytetrahydropterin synthase QueD [Archaeoglobales archaeon]|jgi:6-pyruvoyltetrahydropterin/6-carboxytetrahydropterin synthase|nr:6-carboxytetrahydropterin synthase QueD [Archaeoglobus sp.]NHW88900.1 6-carboxytetrahydropterin synthase QueD [Archaeoglobales archaeon]TDA26678.1 MAG: 6-carboxytetrahydropterin synthase QueD [Archaeoglobi archaeon]